MNLICPPCTGDCMKGRECPAPHVTSPNDDFALDDAETWEIGVFLALALMFWALFAVWLFS